MKIWRGDSDPQGIRQLRATILPGEGLFTNLVNGGNPFALTQQSFLNSIHQHVVSGWSHSHFLSFSKERQIAHNFAIGHSGKNLRLSNQSKWDAVVAEVDLACLTHLRQLAVGIEHYQFNEAGINQQLVRLAPFHLLGKYFSIRNRRAAGISPSRNIMVVDVYQHLLYLSQNGSLVDPRALTYSQRDEEVLILPLDSMYGGGGGNTAMLDLGCMSGLEFYELI